MEFKKTYYLAHIFVTFLAFITFLLVVIGFLTPEQISNAALSMIILSVMLIITSVFMFKREEVERITVFYSIAIFAMLIVLSVVISYGY